MRKIIFLFLASVFLFWGCSNKPEKNESTSEDNVRVEEKSGMEGEFKEAKNCDEFIEQYEEWTDNYLEFLERYMKNPMDSKLMNQYVELSQRGADWLMQWNSSLVVCSTKDKYQKRFDEISEKVEKKMKELGLD